MTMPDLEALYLAPWPNMTIIEYLCQFAIELGCTIDPDLMADDGIVFIGSIRKAWVRPTAYHTLAITHRGGTIEFSLESPDSFSILREFFHMENSNLRKCFNG